MPYWLYTVSNNWDKAASSMVQFHSSTGGTLLSLSFSLFPSPAFSLNWHKYVFDLPVK